VKSSNRKAQLSRRKLLLKHKWLNHISTVSHCGVIRASRLRFLKNWFKFFALLLKAKSVTRDKGIYFAIRCLFHLAISWLYKQLVVMILPKKYYGQKSTMRKTKPAITKHSTFDIIIVSKKVPSTCCPPFIFFKMIFNFIPSICDHKIIRGEKMIYCILGITG